jgi:hypothetical protein
VAVLLPGNAHAGDGTLWFGARRADNRIVNLEQRIAWDKLCGGAAIVAFLAAFLPWATVAGTSVAGIDGDGQITVLCAIIGLCALTAGRGVGPLQFGRRLTLATQSATGALVTLVCIPNVSSDSAFGLYVTLLAGCAWVAGAVIGWRSSAPPQPWEEFSAEG